ncbi:MAG: hypothetical protein ACFB14_01805 [Leptolyngbyaceae cyanobacterium]
MTLFPAIVVFAAVFLFFSKDVLTTEKEEKKEEKKSSKAKPSMADILLKYELMDELGKKS